MRWRTIIALSAVLAVLSPAVNAQVGDNEVTRLANLWTEAYNTGDMERLAGLYTEDAHLYTHGRSTRVGRAAIRDFWAADITENNPITVLHVTDAVQGLDMILVHGNYQVLNRQTGVLLGLGRFAHIWVQTPDGRGSGITSTADGRWLLDRDLWMTVHE